MKSRIAIACLGLLAVGCVHLGPRTVPRDRFDFGTAIAESWKQQTLLGIVKLRYLDVPVFLDVGQVVSSYELETGVELSGQLAPVNRGDTFGSLGGHSVFTDRPTITYTPLTGTKFLRGLITPIPIASILRTVQTGYAADFVLGWTVESLNGLRNRSTVAGSTREPDPNLVHALRLMREIQAGGGITLGIEERPGQAETVVAVFHADPLPPEVADASAELRRVLGLPSAPRRFTIVGTPGRGANGELAMQPRSLLQIMQSVAAFVDVPAEHLAQHWAVPGVPAGDSEPEARIHSSRRKPADAYAAVRYQGHWFWIDQGDWRTKRVVDLVILLFTLADTRGDEHLPVLTIPTK